MAARGTSHAIGQSHNRFAASRIVAPKRIVSAGYAKVTTYKAISTTS